MLENALLCEQNAGLKNCSKYNYILLEILPAEFIQA